MGILAGVRLYGVQPEMVMCDTVVQGVFKAHSVPCERKSVTGKKHGRGSLHPVGFAIDYRTKHVAGVRRGDTLQMITNDIRAALPCCDVLLEYQDQEQEHIHVEFDPKDDPVFQAAKEAYKGTGKWPPNS
jgi:hypothetical protein